MCRKAPVAAMRTDNDGSDNKVKRSGTVVGVTVRLISTQPVPKEVRSFDIRRRFRFRDGPAYELKVLMPQSTTSRTSDVSRLVAASAFLSTCSLSAYSATIVST